MPNAKFSSDKTAPTRAAASPRMRIENWELCIGQILPNVHSAKLFLSKPLAPGCRRSVDIEFGGDLKAHESGVGLPGGVVP